MVVGIRICKVGTGGSGVRASAALWILDQQGLHKVLLQKRIIKKFKNRQKRISEPPCFPEQWLNAQQCHPWASEEKQWKVLDMVVHAQNPRTQEAEAEDFHKFKASLQDRETLSQNKQQRPCLKANNSNNKT